MTFLFEEITAKFNRGTVLWLFLKLKYSPSEGTVLTFMHLISVLDEIVLMTYWYEFKDVNLFLNF